MSTAAPTSDVPAGGGVNATAEPPRPSAGGQRRRLLRWARWAMGLAALAPALTVGWRFANDQLGANPIAEAMNQLGLWTLILLLACLAMTPLKLVTGWAWPIGFRKVLGLMAFLYVCLHFSFYLAVDQFFDFGEIGRDIVKRKFITVGFAAFLLLIPLALTSTASMTKRLGARRWKRLHRLIYPAAALGVIHFLWRVKSDLREPLVYGAVLAVLLAVRVVAFLRRRHAS